MIAMRRRYAISIIGMEGKNMNHNKKKILKVTALFVLMFFLGWGAGSLQKQQMKKTVETVSVQNQADNWGLGFGAEGTQPTGNVTADELKKYNAWYVGDKNKKIIYLTFDCGYENGNTEPILDALKKHNAKATFFVVGHFLESAPDIVKRMEEEGHAVGNHTYHHPDMSSISELASFQKEIDDVASLYQSITGKEMIKYYRPPQGKYSTENLKMAKELGYNTFFWSLAYVDWNVDNQPTKEEAFDKLLTRIHPGAIVLLHSTSKTNGEILDELLTKWEEMGYTFAPLSELIAES
jgi:delta-lactam-biosynthetic de-N-acetylase